MTDHLTSDDMYDEDIKRLGILWNDLMRRYATKPNDALHVGELARRAVDEAFKIGYVVRVHTSECLLGIGPATLEVVGRVPGHEFNAHGMDHERKRHEVLKAVDDGTDKQIRSAVRFIEPKVR